MPGPFDDIFGAVFGRPPPALDPLMHYTGRVSKQLAGLMIRKWGQMAMAGITCSTPVPAPGGKTRACGCPAGAMCQICQRAACVEHAFVSPTDAELICHRCAFTAFPQIAERYTQPVGQPPPGAAPGRGAAEAAAARRAALEELGLEEGADLATIKRAYRRLAAEHHPDRMKGQAKKSQAESRMKRINQAYTLLVRMAEEEAA